MTHVVVGILCFFHLLQSLEGDGPDSLSATVAGLDNVESRLQSIELLVKKSDESVARELLSRFSKFTVRERAVATGGMAANPLFQKSLLEAVELGKVKPYEVKHRSVGVMRQHADDRLIQKLNSLWPVFQPLTVEQRSEIEKRQGIFKQDQNVDLARGKLLLKFTCQNCHSFNGEGGDLGVELAKVDRADLNHLLGNIIAPSAMISSAYQVKIIETEAGKVITGIITQESEESYTIRTDSSTKVVDKNEIVDIKDSSKSIMPEGLLDIYSDDDIRNLVEYLRK